uniref:(California timema) hypothetical protein n=1 Tax=Timema californicum TaxID=61474 RepID=A0A7R9IX83_TIMCA|nr:unnamed protein product [Timema californicum]
MELPHLGEHCSDSSCKKLDFLPLKCDACKQLFCQEHIKYNNHNCPSAYKKDVQVPVCPLCNTPIPVGRGEQPDVVVGAHIDRDCQSDPARDRRKVFTNKCAAKGCRIKEVVKVLCPECKLNFCLKHRHTTDHQCEGAAGAARRRTAEAAMARLKSKSSKSANQVPQLNVAGIQGAMSEDEALARALALSMESSSLDSQTHLDMLLAQSISQSEQQQRSSVARRCALS